MPLDYVRRRRPFRINVIVVGHNGNLTGRLLLLYTTPTPRPSIKGFVIEGEGLYLPDDEVCAACNIRQKKMTWPLPTLYYAADTHIVGSFRKKKKPEIMKEKLPMIFRISAAGCIQNDRTSRTSATTPCIQCDHFVTGISLVNISAA